MGLAERDANLAGRDATLAERNVALPTERALRMVAEAGIQEVAVGRARVPSSRLVLDGLCRSKATTNISPRRSSCRHKAACECPSSMGVAICIFGEAEFKIS